MLHQKVLGLLILSVPDDQQRVGQVVSAVVHALAEGLLIQANGLFLLALLLQAVGLVRFHA